MACESTATNPRGQLNDKMKRGHVGRINRKYAISEVRLVTLWRVPNL